MKKILLILALLVLQHSAQAFDIPPEAQTYLDKPQIGMPYWQALNQDLPFLLLFANSNDLFSLAKLAPVGQMVYNDFKGMYNFCILNTRDKENETFAQFFDAEKFPALYIINTKTKTYSYIDKKYYNKKDLHKILSDYKNGTL